MVFQQILLRNFFSSSDFKENGLISFQPWESTCIIPKLYGDHELMGTISVAHNAAKLIVKCIPKVETVYNNAKEGNNGFTCPE